MPNRFRRELGLILAWLIFPLVPVVLEDLYYPGQQFQFWQRRRAGPDPARMGLARLDHHAGPAPGLWIPCRRDDAACPTTIGAAPRVCAGCWGEGQSGSRSAPGGALSCVSDVFFGLLYLEQLFPGLFNWVPQIPAVMEVDVGLLGHFVGSLDRCGRRSGPTRGSGRRGPRCGGQRASASGNARWSAAS